MKNKTIATLLVLILLPTLVFSACRKAQSTAEPTLLPENASLSEVQGTVGIKNPDQAAFMSASSEDILQVMGQVKTETDGRVRLDLSTGTIVRVAPNSLFTLESNKVENGNFLTKLTLLAGKVWVTLKGGQMEVDTPSGVASVRGSYMSVWVDPATSDVWVSCLEGWCQAGNTPSAIDLLASEGTVLYSFDPNGTVPPPPPMLRYLTQQEIDDFLANNPEAQAILDAMAATASALPTFTSTITLTPVPPTATFTFTATETYTSTFTHTLRPWPTNTRTPSPTDAPPPNTPTTTDDPTPSGTPNQDTIFFSIIGPESMIFSLPVHFTVDAFDPEGLKDVFVDYTVYDGLGNVVANSSDSFTFDTQVSPYWECDTVFGEVVYPGYTVTWNIRAVDNAGFSTTSLPQTFTFQIPN